MLNVSGTTRVLVATTPVDLRGSFNRLYGLVVDQIKGDPLSGNLFLFTNRRRNRIKILAWDGSGIWICAKRLESGRFSLPVRFHERPEKGYWESQLSTLPPISFSTAHVSDLCH
jgi:transposase